MLQPNISEEMQQNVHLKKKQQKVDNLKKKYQNSIIMSDWEVKHMHASDQAFPK